MSDNLLKNHFGFYKDYVSNNRFIEKFEKY